MTHTKGTRHPAGVYHCGGGQWAGWAGCINARVYEPLLEALVVDAFLKRCAFTLLTETGAVAGSPRQVWEAASLQDRRALLGAVISKIVATPLDPPTPYNQRRVRLNHDISIEWKADLDQHEAIVVVAEQASPPAPPRDIVKHRAQRFRKHEVRVLEQAVAEPEIPSAVGKTWAEYQRELLGRRSGASGRVRDGAWGS